jgi:hypothetical protein
LLIKYKFLQPFSLFVFFSLDHFLG